MRASRASGACSEASRLRCLLTYRVRSAVLGIQSFCRQSVVNLLSLGSPFPGFGGASSSSAAFLGNTLRRQWQWQLTRWGCPPSGLVGLACNQGSQGCLLLASLIDLASSNLPHESPLHQRPSTPPTLVVGCLALHTTELHLSSAPTRQARASKYTNEEPAPTLPPNILVIHIEKSKKGRKKVEKGRKKNHA